MLSMRIERAPLSDTANRAILDGYNRLTKSNIPTNEFVHWVRENPAGPAWHALLETAEGRIVGHTSVFPLRTGFGSGSVVPAKSEYSFLHEDFRKEKVEGYENASKPPFIILLDQLFKHCQGQGWGPIFASTNEKNQVFTRRVGLRPVSFPLWECLLALKPRKASRLTPNLTRMQRLGLLSAGIAQSTLWSLGGRLRTPRGIREAAVDSNGFPMESERLAFFEDRESLEWRYLKGQYARVELETKSGGYVIFKNGSVGNFLRVCQWRLRETKGIAALLSELVRRARREGALGVRWAVYDGEAESEELVGRLRRAGFLCARRTRTVMIHNKSERYLEPRLWRINDSLFSFDP